MADKTFNVQVFDGATEFAGNTTSLLKLYKNSSSEYDGNVAGVGDFTYQGAGIWSVGVAEADSGVYIVKKSTDSGGTYTAVTGLDPVPILMKNMLMLAGGTMEGSINMASNSITDIRSISFRNATANLHGIEVGNLLDKSATETVTGAWTHSGANTFTGVLNVESASRFQLGGVPLSAALTASDLNMLRGLYTSDAKVLTTAKASGAVQTTISETEALTAEKAGLILVSTSDGVVTLTMPLISKDNAGAVFIIYISSYGSALTIAMNGSDLGFALATGAATTVIGDTMLLNSLGAFVILMNTGIEAGRWAILGANSMVLSETI